MNLALHLFKKDFRHTRIPVAVWLVLVLIQCSLVGIGFDPSDHIMQALYAVLLMVVPLLQIFLLLVIVPLVVQAEPLVGTTAFWFTRPIDRQTLLRSKGFFASLLILLPLMAELVVLAFNGATARDLGLAIPEIILDSSVSILSIALVAAFTRNFGQFAIVTVILTVVAILFAIATSFYGLFVDPDAILAQHTDFPLLKSRTIVSQITELLILSAVIVRFYLTRRLISSIALACACMAITHAQRTFWPWNFMEPPHSRVATPPSFTDVKITLGNIETSDAISFRNSDHLPRKNVQATLDVIGVPAKYIITFDDIRPRLTTQDGINIPTHPAQNNYMSMRLNSSAIKAAFDDSVTVMNPDPNHKTIADEASLFVLDGTTFASNAASILKFSAMLSLRISQYQITGAVPLKKGGLIKLPDSRVVITDILRDGQNATILIQEKKIQLLFDRRRLSYEVPDNESIFSSDTVYVLRNSKRNEIVLPSQRPSMNFTAQLTSASRLNNRNVKLEFLTQDDRPLTSEWIEEADLVRLDLHEVAKLPREISTDNFRFNRRNQ